MEPGLVEVDRPLAIGVAGDQVLELLEGQFPGLAGEQREALEVERALPRHRAETGRLLAVRGPAGHVLEQPAVALPVHFPRQKLVDQHAARVAPEDDHVLQVATLRRARGNAQNVAADPQPDRPGVRGRGLAGVGSDAPGVELLQALGRGPVVEGGLERTEQQAGRQDRQDQAQRREAGAPDRRGLPIARQLDQGQDGGQERRHGQQLGREVRQPQQRVAQDRRDQFAPRRANNVVRCLHQVEAEDHQDEPAQHHDEAQHQQPVQIACEDAHRLSACRLVTSSRRRAISAGAGTESGPARPGRPRCGSRPGCPG